MIFFLTDIDLIFYAKISHFIELDPKDMYLNNINVHWNHTPIFCRGLFIAHDGGLLNNILGTYGYQGNFFFFIGGLREIILFIGPICLYIKQFEIIYQNY